MLNNQLILVWQGNYVLGLHSNFSIYEQLYWEGFLNLYAAEGREFQIGI
jgi:hypothetical protein